ncbi:hypothetical protein AVEN_147925-1 [Araneus ventricosus]|uniref:Uncharacterized protein n=1 Tax=Araneus ventricosus TaxID=182803 RepID=A0A4Y2UW56_ARAVE|nr:hypothetical protein AVEN_147925-1 [Araneus ventricosus]
MAGLSIKSSKITNFSLSIFRRYKCFSTMTTPELAYRTPSFSTTPEWRRLTRYVRFRVQQARIRGLYSVESGFSLGALRRSPEVDPNTRSPRPRLIY